MPPFPVSQNIDKWCSRVSSILSFTVIMFLLVHQTCKLTERRKKVGNTKPKQCSFKLFISDIKNNNVSWSLVSSYFLLIFSVITLVSCMLIKWTNSFPYYTIQYKYESYCIATGYTLSKFCLYILLSYRIEESFINSSYSYNKTFVWLWRIYLFAGVVIFIGSYILHTKIHDTQTIYPQWLIIYAVIFDFMACLVNLILFTRQLYAFTQDCIESISSDYQFIEEFKMIIKKQVILATISIISTLLSLLTVILFGVPVFCISFDLFVTNICVVLMFSWNSKYFVFCCACFNKVINDAVIEGISLSKLSTARLANVACMPPTPSLTASTCVEFSSFPNRLNRRAKQTNDVSTSISFAIDISTKNVKNMHKIEEEPASSICFDKISQKPNVFVSISSSVTSVGGGSSCDSNQSTPVSMNSNQLTPTSMNSITLPVPSKFPSPIYISNSTNSLTALDDADEDFETSEEYDDEVP